MHLRSFTLVASLAACAALCVLATACSPVAVLNATLPKGTHSERLGLAYGPMPRQQLDLYLPAAAAPPGGYPVALFFYGGTWNSGERADYRFVGEALAARGIVAVLADYRLYPEASYPAFLEDCARALAYTLDQAAGWGGNPRRVFVSGHSAGAYNAAMLALDARWLAPFQHSPDELAGWIGLAGPYDFLPSDNPDVQPVFHAPDYPPGALPIDHVSAQAPRSFLGAARQDKLVDPQRNTAQLAQRLQARGVPVTLKLYDRVNHMTLAGAFARPLRFLAPVLDDVAQFVVETPLATIPSPPSKERDK